MNLVLAAMNQVATIPGVDKATLAKMAATKAGALQGTGNPCNNPTFKPGDDPSHNVLVDSAPFPPGCNAACAAPWKLAGSGTAKSGPKFTTTNSGSSAGAGPSAAATPTPCDTDASDCSTNVQASGGQADGIGKVVPVSTVLPGQYGWAPPQTLMILGGLLVLALLIAPPLIGRALKRGGRDE
jgi:phosphate transport system substrate-binding protein